MTRVYQLTRSRWLWLTLLAIGLLLVPLFLLQVQEPSGLMTRLFPIYLEQTVVYDENGNVLNATTVRAVGDPARLESLQACAEDMAQTTQPQMQRAFQAGETEFKTQHTCR